MISFECVVCHGVKDLPHVTAEDLGGEVVYVPGTLHVGALCPSCQTKSCPDCGRLWAVHEFESTDR